MANIRILIVDDHPVVIDHYHAFIIEVLKIVAPLVPVVKFQSAYFEKSSENTASFISAMGISITVIFSLGAIIGAVITMYAAVAQRQREIGTLRALGFSRLTILLSFLLESVVLALVGGALGGATALCMSFVRFSMMNFNTWSEVVFSFEPTLEIIVSSIVVGGVMGVLGGLFPAVRAARVSPIDAMRA